MVTGDAGLPRKISPLSFPCRPPGSWSSVPCRVCSPLFSSATRVWQVIIRPISPPVAHPTKTVDSFPLRPFTSCFRSLHSQASTTTLDCEAEKQPSSHQLQQG